MYITRTICSVPYDTLLKEFTHYFILSIKKAALSGGRFYGAGEEIDVALRRRVLLRKPSNGRRVAPAGATYKAPFFRTGSRFIALAMIMRESGSQKCVRPRLPPFH